MHHRVLIGGSCLAMLGLAACNQDVSTSPSGISDANADASASAIVGAVYTQTNASTGNAILAYHRMGDGSLVRFDSVATGGVGVDTLLGSQGAVTLSSDQRWLLAVNAGSNDVSLFGVGSDGALTLHDRVPSGGTFPNSVAIQGSLVYVLNAAGSGNITGFQVSGTSLTMIAGSTRPLSGSGVGPAQVEFSPQGTWIVVTEKLSNKIDTYRLQSGGTTTGPNVNPSSGVEPFGFKFTDGGALVVSEAFQGAPDASAISTYEVRSDGSLRTITSSLQTTETAACWIAITPNNMYAYSSNTGSGTVTGVANNSGNISLLDANGVTGNVGANSAPIDAGIAHGGHYLYVLGSGTHEIAGFMIAADGSLSSVTTGVSGLFAGTVGLAVY